MDKKLNMALEKLASALGRNDEQPNIDLAIELVKRKDKLQIKELIDGLADKKTLVANDCIKVLYEIGAREPGLIAEHALVFIELLQSKNNRFVWGAMTALAQIAPMRAQEIFAHFEAVRTAFEKGSVITVDNGVSVLAQLSKADKKYEAVLFPLILQHLKTCRAKEIPQHAERAAICVNGTNAALFKNVLGMRQAELTEAQKKRVDKVLQKLADQGVNLR